MINAGNVIPKAGDREKVSVVSTYRLLPKGYVYSQANRRNRETMRTSVVGTRHSLQ